MISRITVQGRAVFQCRGCLCWGIGDSFTVEVASPEDIPFADRTLPATYMPVGWASYGQRTYDCPSCLEKK